MELVTVWASGFGNTLALIVAIGAQNALLLRAGIRGRNVGMMVLVCIASDVLLMTLGVLGIGALVHTAPAFVTVASWAGAAFLVLYAAFAIRRAVRPSALVVPDADDEPVVEDAADAITAGDRALVSTSGHPVLDARTADTDLTPSGAHHLAASSGPGTASARPGERRNPAAGGRGTGRRAALLSILAVTYLNPHCYLDTVVLLGSIANTHGEVLRWIFLAGGIVASSLWFPLLGYGAKRLRPFFASPRSWRLLDIGIAVVMLVIAVRLVAA